LDRQELQNANFAQIPKRLLKGRSPLKPVLPYEQIRPFLLRPAVHCQSFLPDSWRYSAWKTCGILDLRSNIQVYVVLERRFMIGANVVKRPLRCSS
jgi:hypothetical protein